MTDAAHRAADRSEATLIVVLDISTAFDAVVHSILARQSGLRRECFVVDQLVSKQTISNSSCWFSLVDTIQLQLWNASRIGVGAVPLRYLHISIAAIADVHYAKPK